MAKIDFKQAAIDHVEKGIFGIFVLVVLLALLGTKWVPYKGMPHEITDKIRQGRTNLANHTWPEEEQEKYKITAEQTPANILHQNLYAEFDPRPYEVSIKLKNNPWDGSEPLREPVLVKPENAIANGGRVLIHLAATKFVSGEDEQSVAATDTKKPMDLDDEAIPDEFRVRTTRPAGMAGGEIGGLMGGEEYGTAAIELAYSSEMESGYMAEGGLGAGGMKLEGRGYHYASIRAVFPLRDQIRKYAEAINRSYHDAARMFEIIDFELERQTALVGEDDPWSGPWEKVDIDVAFDVLDAAAGFEPDVVNTMITNSVITMPLPMRISGQWRTHATHPRIQKFELTEEEVAREVEMNRRLLEDAVQQRKATRQTVVERKGFAPVAFDGREIFGSVMGAESIYDMESEMGMGMGGGMGAGGPGMTIGTAARQRPGAPGRNSPNDKIEQLVKRLAEGKASTNEQEKVLREWIQQRVSVEGELLLFRYFDFSVEPGKIYRYRVRFVLNNPNFGQSITAAGGLEHVVSGATRETDWSNITDPVKIAEDVKYFVHDVRRPGVRMLPQVRMDVYQWDTKYGTTMNDRLDLLLGQKIHDEVETLVIKPAESFHGREKYPFASDAYLVDALEDLDLDESFHANDRIEPQYRLTIPRLGQRNRLALTDEVLVRTIEGELKALNPVRLKLEHDRMKSLQKYQEDQFAALKEAKKPTTGFSDEYSDLIGGAEGDMYAGDMEAGPRRRNVLRRGGTRTRGGDSGYP